MAKCRVTIIGTIGAKQEKYQMKLKLRSGLLDFDFFLISFGLDSACWQDKTRQDNIFSQNAKNTTQQGKSRAIG